MVLELIHKKHILIWLIFVSSFFPPSSAFSQIDTTEDQTELFDVYVSAGSSRFPSFSVSQDDFKKIVPGSAILSGDIMKVNFNDFNNASGGGFYINNANSAVYMQAGITLKLKNKQFKGAGPWLKLGMNYFSSSTIINAGVFNSSTATRDSTYLVANLPVNSTTVSTRSVTYEYSCQSVNLESTLIYRLNPNGIFSLFGGPGALLGLNFGGRAKLQETDEKTTNDYLFATTAGKTLYKSNTETAVMKEEYNLHPNLCFGLFIDIGVDLRLGNNYNYIKSTHLFMEVKPMFRSYAVKGAGFQNSVILVGNVGLRYEL